MSWNKRGRRARTRLIVGVVAGLILGFATVIAVLIARREGDLPIRDGFIEPVSPAPETPGESWDSER